MGYLGVGAEGAGLLEVFGQGLQELGRVEGQNIVIEHRFGEGELHEPERGLLEGRSCGVGPSMTDGSWSVAEVER